MRRLSPRTAPWAASSALVLVASLALSACSGSDDPESQPTSAAPAPSRAPKPAFVEGEPATVNGFPTQFDKSRETVFPETGVVDVALSEDRALTAGGAQVIARTLPELADAYTVNADTGSFVDVYVDDETGEGYALSQDIQTGSGTSLGTEYYSVQRFDLETGEVTGDASVDFPQDSAGGGASRIGWIVGVDEDLVVVGMRGEGEETNRSTAVMDMSTGKTDWSLKRGNPLALVDGLVIVNTGTEAKPAPVNAYDVANGKKTWESLVFTKTASYVGTSGDNVVIASTDGYYNLSAVAPLSLKNGKPDKQVKAREVAGSNLACEPSGDDEAVCTDPDGVVTAWDLAKAKELWTLPTDSRIAPTITDVQDGLIYGHAGDLGDVVLDAASGEDVVTVAGVSPMDVNTYGGIYIFVGAALFTPVNEPEEDAGDGTSDGAGDEASESAE